MLEKERFVQGTEVQHCGPNKQELTEKGEMNEEWGSHCQGIQY